MGQQFNLRTRKKIMRPKHHADTNLWHAWPEDPGEVVNHNGVLFTWTIEKTTVRPPYSNICGIADRNNQVYEVKKWYSTDLGKNWYEDTKTVSYKWVGRDDFPKSDTEKILDDAILSSKKKWRKQRNNQKSRERRKKLKKEAENLGISIGELQNRKSEERKKMNPSGASKKSIEDTQRKVKIGPVLKELQNELNYVLEKFNTDEIRIKHVDRNKTKFKKMVHILRDWQGRA